MNKNVVVNIKNLFKSFKNSEGEPLNVLHDIQLDIFEHEFVALVGYSGCGKTTLLRIMCGFEKADEGSVYLDGQIHTFPNKDVLMLFQDFNQLLPWKTVIKNVTFPLIATRSASKKDAYELAVKRLQDVGLSKFHNYYPHQLSGGMKQRTAVARALALQPRVLLMDEPFAALDNNTRETLQILTRRVCEKYGITTVFVTHSVEEAVIMADRIVVMNEKPGRIDAIIENTNRKNHDSISRTVITEDIVKILNLNKQSYL